MQISYFPALFAALFFPYVVNALDNITFGNFAHSATDCVARELGFYAHYDLNVIYAQIPNSTFAFQQLANGGYDVLSGQIDNAVNLHLNSNQSLTVLGELDPGEYSWMCLAMSIRSNRFQGPELVFASIPSITSVTELRGKTIIVDSPTSVCVVLVLVYDI